VSVDGELGECRWGELGKCRWGGWVAMVEVEGAFHSGVWGVCIVVARLVLSLWEGCVVARVEFTRDHSSLAVSDCDRHDTSPDAILSQGGGYQGMRRRTTGRSWQQPSQSLTVWNASDLGRYGDQRGQRRQPPRSLAHLKRSITEVRWRGAKAWAESRVTGKKNSRHKAGLGPSKCPTNGSLRGSTG